MKITDEQRAEILPLLQQATQALIDKWDAQGAIESVLGTSLDGVSDGIESLAISYGSGSEVTLLDVDIYLEEFDEDEDN